MTEKLYPHTNTLVDYLAQRWGVTYSVSGLNKLLHRQGFSYKKSKGRPYKAEPDKQASFIKAYKRFKSSVNKDERILFMDSVHPTLG